MGETDAKYLARWDAENGFAEVWVNVDTVWGNDSAQQVIMLWGNPSASSESGGPAVFDSAVRPGVEPS